MGKYKLNIPLKDNFAKTKIAVIVPYFNEDIGLKLYRKTAAELTRCGVKKQNIALVRVPGSLEIPLAASRIAQKKSHNAIIALGVVIKGETDHFKHVSRETYNGIMKISLKYGIPIVAGVLTVNNKKQVIERIKKGADFARNALFMSKL